MSFFDVPGWSVPAAPTPDSSTRKRKRPQADDGNKIHTAEINFEKLIKKLDSGNSKSSESPRSQSKKKKNQKERGGDKNGGKPVGIEHQKVRPQKPAETTPSTTPRKSKPSRKGKESSTKSSPASSQKKTTPQKSNGGLTALQSSMQNGLDGARFRWINEVLYKSDSDNAHKMMQEDKIIFDEYHKGFRHQVESWPQNPVSHYISALSTYPAKTVIADLGCGDAALARALIPKGFTVLSFDLVSDGAFVIEGDIFGRLPLPGSETAGEDDESGGKTEGHGNVVDVVVCALSLMGTNWPNCVREAWRVLRPGGELKIAEVSSRFTDVEKFKSLVSSFGFKLKTYDNSNTHFMLFDFKKVARKPRAEGEWTKLLQQGSLLKPCEYKRR